MKSLYLTKRNAIYPLCPFSLTSKNEIKLLNLKNVSLLPDCYKGKVISCVVITMIYLQ